VGRRLERVVMGPKLEILTAAGAAGLVLAALLACKKDQQQPEPVASASAAAAPSASVSAAAAPEAGTEVTDAAADASVKRYGDKELFAGGTVKVLVANLPVYADVDVNSEKLATVPGGTYVNLKARYQDFYLIAYPSEPGKLELGWIQQKIDGRSPISERVKWDAGAGQQQGAGDAGVADAGSAVRRGRRRTRE
jgi:hypothetical protein